MASFGNFWNGAVVLFKVLVIFVKAWCCAFATFLSRETLYATYFPNLRRKLLSYFFLIEFYWNCYRKILRDNRKPNRTLSIIFVLKLRFRENPLWYENLKLNVAWKYALRDNPNFADKLCVEFFKFRKYYAAHNSGLKTWLLPDFPTENPLLNGMFYYICNGLVLVFATFLSRETLVAILWKIVNKWKHT